MPIIRHIKILHISTFDERSDHRLFNISIANKISKGFIRNDYKRKLVDLSDIRINLKGKK